MRRTLPLSLIPPAWDAFSTLQLSVRANTETRNLSMTHTALRQRTLMRDRTLVCIEISRSDTNKRDEYEVTVTSELTLTVI